MSTEPAAWGPESVNRIVFLSWTVLNTLPFAIFTAAPGSNCEPVIVPHVPAVVTTFGVTPAIMGWRPVGVGAGSMTEGGVAGDDTLGAGSDDGTDGEGDSPPQAAVVNASISNIPIVVSFKFALAF
jgi:hypothetical protein